MINKIILLTTLLSYAIIASQPFMYLLALKKVQLSLDAKPYTEIRKLIDSSMSANFKYVIYIVLLSNLMLVFVTISNRESLLSITAVIALLCLVIDVLLTVKGNVPINITINTWTSETIPADWQAYRMKWLNIFQYRQIANITGFVSLLIGTVFGTK